jgi:hypothetical protein
MSWRWRWIAFGFAAGGDSGAARDVPTYVFRILPAYICINSTQARRHSLCTPTNSQTYIPVKTPPRHGGDARQTQGLRVPKGAISVTPLVKKPFVTPPESPLRVARREGKGNKNSRRAARYRDIFDMYYRARAKEIKVSRRNVLGNRSSILDGNACHRRPMREHETRHTGRMVRCANEKRKDAGRRAGGE